jgi:two-component system chemotaxis sensor kinase CheA
VAELLRESDPLWRGALPIIMMTSLASDESRPRARDAGVSAYIVKGEVDQKRFLIVSAAENRRAGLAREPSAPGASDVHSRA